MQDEEHAADAAGSGANGSGANGPEAKDAAPAPGPNDPPEVHAAAEAVEKAKAALREAQECYQRVREQASARLKQVRETRVGDLIDGLLGLVRKYPGAGVITALLAGFFLGRRFRR
jgi:hypothetical protein